MGATGQRIGLERLVASVHDATLDDSGWPAASVLIDEACGSKGNFMVIGSVAEGEDVEVQFARFCYRGERSLDWEREYFHVLHPLDERVPRLRRLPDADLVPVSSLYRGRELKESPVYAAMASAETRQGLNACVRLGSAAHLIWQVADPVDAAGWSSERVAVLERLMPHLRQFARVRQALVRAGALGATLEGLLDNGQVGVVQLDRRGGIIAANDAALQTLRAADGLRDADGMLRASWREDDPKLQALLAAAVPAFGPYASSGSARLRCADGRAPLVVHVTPVTDSGSEQRPGTVAALVLIVDVGRRARIDPVAVAGALALTDAQGEVAALVAEGLTTEEVAAATGRGKGTVRWHLHHIFAKAGVRRQAELVRLVLAVSTLPGGRPAGRRP